VVGRLFALFALNELVMTDDVLRSLTRMRMPEAEVEGYLAMIRRGEILGYLLVPPGLLVRTGLLALCVQLALLPFVPNPPFRWIFRASLWAEVVLLLQSALHTLRLALLAPTEIHPQLLGTRPAALSSLLPSGIPAEGPAHLLFQQVGLFDVAWILLFVLALERGRRLPLLPATLAVGAVWTSRTLLVWLATLSLSALG